MGKVKRKSVSDGLSLDIPKADVDAIVRKLDTYDLLLAVARAGKAVRDKYASPRAMIREVIGLIACELDPALAALESAGVKLEEET